MADSHRLRVPESIRLEFLNAGVKLCDEAMGHFQKCPECASPEAAELCPAGQKLYEVMVFTAKRKYLGLDDFIRKLDDAKSQAKPSK